VKALTTTAGWLQKHLYKADLERLNIRPGSVPEDLEISYEELLDSLGLWTALYCCKAEPKYWEHWHKFAMWCWEQHSKDVEIPVTVIYARNNPKESGLALDHVAFHSEFSHMKADIFLRKDNETWVNYVIKFGELYENSFRQLVASGSTLEIN
jgi:hypothetical protein